MTLFDEVWLRCIQEGQAACRVGVAIHRCPPFRISEMVDGWRLGWHQMESALSKKHEDLTAVDYVVLGLAWPR